MLKYSYKVLRPFEIYQLNFYGYYYGNLKDIANCNISLCKNIEQLKKTINKEHLFQLITVIKIDNNKLTKLKYNTNIDGDEYPCIHDKLDKNTIVDSFLLESNVNDNSFYIKKLDNLDKYI